MGNLAKLAFSDDQRLSELLKHAQDEPAAPDQGRSRLRELVDALTSRLQAAVPEEQPQTEEAPAEAASAETELDKAEAVANQGVNRRDTRPEVRTGQVDQPEKQGIGDQLQGLIGEFMQSDLGRMVGNAFGLSPGAPEEAVDPLAPGQSRAAAPQDLQRGPGVTPEALTQPADPSQPQPQERAGARALPENVNAVDRFGNMYYVHDDGRVWRRVDDPSTGGTSWAFSEPLSAGRLPEGVTPEQREQQWYDHYRSELLNSPEYRRAWENNPEEAKRLLQQRESRLQSRAKNMAQNETRGMTRRNGKASAREQLDLRQFEREPGQQIYTVSTDLDGDGVPEQDIQTVGSDGELQRGVVTWRAGDQEALARQKRTQQLAKARQAHRENRVNPNYVSRVAQAYRAAGTQPPQWVQEAMADPEFASQVEAHDRVRAHQRSLKPGTPIDTQAVYDQSLAAAREQRGLPQIQPEAQPQAAQTAGAAAAGAAAGPAAGAANTAEQLAQAASKPGGTQEIARGQTPAARAAKSDAAAAAAKRTTPAGTGGAAEEPEVIGEVEVDPQGRGLANPGSKKLGALLLSAVADPQPKLARAYDQARLSRLSRILGDPQLAKTAAIFGSARRTGVGTRRPQTFRAPRRRPSGGPGWSARIDPHRMSRETGIMRFHSPAKYTPGMTKSEGQGPFGSRRVVNRPMNRAYGQPGLGGLALGLGGRTTIDRYGPGALGRARFSGPGLSFSNRLRRSN